MAAAEVESLTQATDSSMIKQPVEVRNVGRTHVASSRVCCLLLLTVEEPECGGFFVSR